MLLVLREVLESVLRAYRIVPPAQSKAVNQLTRVIQQLFTQRMDELQARCVHAGCSPRTPRARTVSMKRPHRYNVGECSSLLTVLTLRAWQTLQYRVC